MFLGTCMMINFIRINCAFNSKLDQSSGLINTRRKETYHSVLKMRFEVQCKYEFSLRGLHYEKVKHS